MIERNPHIILMNLCRIVWHFAFALLGVRLQLDPDGLLPGEE